MNAAGEPEALGCDQPIKDANYVRRVRTYGYVKAALGPESEFTVVNC